MSIICLVQVVPLILAFIDSSVKLGPYGEEIHCLPGAHSVLLRLVVTLLIQGLVK